MKRLIHVLFLLLLVACAKDFSVQKQVLDPWAAQWYVGGSLRAVLQAFPQHQSLDHGMYYFESRGPAGARRTVRLRGEGDTILWLQIQDIPVAPEWAAEQQRFEREIDRLEKVFGPAEKKGDNLYAKRTAAWNYGDDLHIELQLDVSEDQQTIRRTISLAQL